MRNRQRSGRIRSVDAWACLATSTDVISPALLGGGLHAQAACRDEGATVRVPTATPGRKAALNLPEDCADLPHTTGRGRFISNADYSRKPQIPWDLFA